MTKFRGKFLVKFKIPKLPLRTLVYIQVSTQGSPEIIVTMNYAIGDQNTSSRGSRNRPVSELEMEGLLRDLKGSEIRSWGSVVR